jgi:hypothetical protein
MNSVEADSSTIKECRSGSQPERMISPIMAKCPWSTSVIAERELLRGTVDSAHSMSVSL